MQILIAIMIYGGSALMLYNVIRYGAFVKRRVKLEQQNRENGLLAVPLILLIFFLIGYLAVGLSGMADLLIAAILFFGSVYVFIMLAVVYSIIRRIQDTENVLSNRYEEMKDELNALIKDSLAVFRVNLTRDEVEQRSGEYLYESDLASDRYSQLMEARGRYLVNAGYGPKGRELFTREGLLRQYSEGLTSAEEVQLVRRSDGEISFVHFQASLTKKPVSGDVVAFLVERPYNEEVVRQILMERVLMDEYDRIAYLINGKYKVLISNDGKKKGLLLPPDEEGTYEELYLNYILPATPRDREKSGRNPLRLSVIDKALAERDTYDVNAPFIIDGVTRYKHIVFYVIDRKAKYYLMLLSDSTAVQEEQALRNKRLSDALEEAVRANQARTQFFTNISHDLRNPMNGILGFTDLAREERDPEKRREYLDKVDISGRQLLGLMDDLLAMSLIESGKLELELGPVNLTELANGMQELRSTEGRAKNMRLEVDCTGLHEPRVMADGPKLTHVLNRLLENACHYSREEGTVSLILGQTGETDPEPGIYTVEIHSPGGRIPEEILDKIFLVSTWEDSSSRNELPGVGLGMSVVKAYIDLMGGAVTVTSSEEDGTRFLIRLPLTPKPEASRERSPLLDRKLRVLLVDDNEINREIGELMLTGEGFAVDLACDGAEAVEKVSASAPGAYDAVLMDVQMPVMNGYEATAAIRALPDPILAGIPIIALTANAYQEDANTALAAGMDGYAAKPIDPAKISETIAQALRDREEDPK